MENKIETLEMYPQYSSKPLSGEQSDAVAVVRCEFANAHHAIMKHLPEGRYKAIVATKLEEAAMFATKAISHTPQQ